jgi:hypothetical protein
MKRTIHLLAASWLTLAFAAFVPAGAGAAIEPGGYARCDVTAPTFALAYRPIKRTDTTVNVVVLLRCHGNGGPVTVEVDLRSPSRTQLLRRLGGGDGIVYGVYHDGQPFGDGSRNGSWHYLERFDALSGTVERSFAVQIVVPARQDVAVGSYVDTLPLDLTTY